MHITLPDTHLLCNAEKSTDPWITWMNIAFTKIIYNTDYKIVVQRTNIFLL